MGGVGGKGGSKGGVCFFLLGVERNVLGEGFGVGGLGGVCVVGCGGVERNVG